MTRDWVTIVSGLPRSGTSMMMQMLAAGGMPVLSDHVRGADRDNPRGYFEFEAVKRTRSDQTWLPQAVGKAVKMVHLLLHDLPATYEYRVLLMQRNMDEVLASQRAMLDRLGRQGAAGGVDLADVFRKQLSEIEAWLAQQPNFRVQPVDYHAVVADPQMQSARINEFLGGGLDPSVMAEAVDPTLYRNRSS